VPAGIFRLMASTAVVVPYTFETDTMSISAALDIQASPFGRINQSIMRANFGVSGQAVELSEKSGFGGAAYLASCLVHCTNYGRLCAICARIVCNLF
jgi:hypothetical protein